MKKTLKILKFLSACFSKKKVASSSKNHSEKKPLPPAKDQQIHFRFSDTILEIPSLNFIGSYCYSPNKLWAIAWEKSHSLEEDADKSNDKVNGRVVLYDVQNNKIGFSTDKITMPEHCSVSNNGYSCVVDSRFSDGSINKLNIFNNVGEVLFEREIRANIFNAQISNFGKFIIYQTLNSKADDANKLTLIDLTTKENLFSIETIYGRAVSYEIDEENKVVLVKLAQHEDVYRYDFNGNMIDSDKFDHDTLKSDNYDSIIPLVKNLLNTTAEKKDLSFIIEQLHRIEPLVEKENQSYLALLYKNLGIAYELLSDKEKAIEFYEKALERNAKIGVKRKLSSLKK